MPIYEYRCLDCAQIFEEWQKDFEDRCMTCPVCGGGADRLISRTSFALKGSGWYATDYCGRSPAGNGGGAATAGEAKPANSSASSAVDNAGADASGAGVASSASTSGAPSSEDG